MITSEKVLRKMTEIQDGQIVGPGHWYELRRWLLEDEQTRALPFDFDEEIKWILGQPNFACIGIANSLRRSGQQIENKSEAEQAAAIYWMLEMYQMHGKNWRKAGDEFLKQVYAR